MNNLSASPATAWKKYGAVLVSLAALVYFFTICWLALQRHARFESSEDLAMFDQMLWSVRQGFGLVTSLSGNAHLLFPHHFFGEHVSPILYLLAWPAGLTSGPETLLVLQTLALALAVFPLWRLAVVWTGSERLGVFAAILWLVQPALWGAALYDFHMEAFEGLFLFGFTWALTQGRWTVILWAALYASCKEDAPLYLAAVSFLLGWKFQRWRLALPIGLGALLYALIAVLWIGPAFSPTDNHLLTNRLLTPANCGGLWPWLQEVLWHGYRWKIFARHLLALGLLPLLGGRLILPAAMAIGLMWISSDDAQALLQIHYPLTIYPPLFLAAVAGLHTLSQGCSREQRPLARRVAITSLVVLTLIGLYRHWVTLDGRNRELSRGRAPDLAASYRAARTVLQSIPSHTNEWVATLPTLAPHLARRKNLTLTMYPREADWLVLRFDGLVYPFDPARYHDWLTTLLATNSPFGVYALGDERIVILRYGHAHALNATASRIERGVDAEDLLHAFGRPVTDHAALNELVWEAGPHERGGYVLYGPYLKLVPGRYRISYRAKATGVSVAQPVFLR